MSEITIVLGGCGYIGSETVWQLSKQGKNILVIDNLVTGNAWAIPNDVKMVEGDYADPDIHRDIIANYSCIDIVHLAGETVIPSNLNQPLHIFHENIVKTISLLRLYESAPLRRFIFSSSSAVYGNVELKSLSESTPCAPANAYGFSKYAVEETLRWFSNSTSTDTICFRYFNAAGASSDVGEPFGRPHLIPKVIETLLRRYDCVSIFGDDYDTRDGTCIRDYTHVSDIAEAHVLALSTPDVASFDVFNLGYGVGYTVKEVIKHCLEVTSLDCDVEILPRRDGDVPNMLADGKKAQKILGWKPKYHEIAPIIRSTYEWMNKIADKNY